MPGLSSFEAGEFIDEFRQQLSEQAVFINEETQITITFSCGVSDDIGQSLDQQIGHADENLYRAKEAGRNQVVY